MICIWVVFLLPKKQSARGALVVFSSNKDENATFEVFLCTQEDDFCTSENPCAEDEGDCDIDEDCQNGFVCGSDSLVVAPDMDCCYAGKGTDRCANCDDCQTGLRCGSSRFTNGYPASWIGI